MRLFCWFLFFFVSRRICLFRPFWPCVLLLGVFLGVPFWAPRVFGILLELMGLELARPFRGPFLGTRGGKGFPVLLLPCFFFFPFLFCGYDFSRKARPVISRRPAAGDLARPPRPSEGRGIALSRAEGWPPPFVGF